MKLIGSRTEDLESRWNQLAQAYGEQLDELRSLLLNLSRTHDELTIIRDELVSRDVEVDDGCLEEMKKTY